MMNMMKEEAVNELELVSSEMWVAREIQMLGEWHLRANNGVSYRANSVLPIGSSGREFWESIHYCTSFYSKRGLPTSFQLTSFSVPRELDAFLEDAGWDMGIIVETEIRDLSDIPPRIHEYPVEINDIPTPSWMKAFLNGSHRKSSDAQERMDLMMRSKIPKAFAQIRVEDAIACVGVGMVHKSWLGMFRIATLPAYRRRGLASALTIALLAWGQENGARNAFLQVESDNDGAKHMYNGLGFEHAYTYWYRTKEE